MINILTSGTWGMCWTDPEMKCSLVSMTVRCFHPMQPFRSPNMYHSITTVICVTWFILSLRRGSQAAVDRVVEFLSAQTKTITTTAKIAQVLRQW